MEADSTDRKNALLGVVAAVFDEHGTWPIRQYVEARLEQDNGLELDACLDATPENLVAASGFGEESEVALRVAGLVAAGSTTIVKRFVETLRWCVDELDGSLPVHPGTREEVRVTSGQLRDEWAQRGVEVGDLDLKKLLALIQLEGIHGGLSGDGHEWSLVLTRPVFRRYREVETVRDYLAVRSEMETPRPSSEAVPVQSEVALEPAVEDTAAYGFASAVEERCGRLLRDGHYESAALESIKAMAGILRERSGLELDGEALAGKALAPPDPLVRVVGVGGATGDGVQRGVMQMVQGVFQAIRNPLAHLPLSLSREEANRDRRDCELRRPDRRRRRPELKCPIGKVRVPGRPVDPPPSRSQRRPRQQCPPSAPRREPSRSGRRAHSRRRPCRGSRPAHNPPPYRRRRRPRPGCA
jgi:uncharacterized protein (TIGR02391 family)